MTWLLVFVVVHVSSAPDPYEVPGFTSERECLDFGNAWRAQIYRRENQTDVVSFHCKARGTELRRATP